MTKNNKGITLIALVVTIIVLIILAAVSINLLLSDNGIIKKARDAKLNYEVAANEESSMLKGLEDLIDAKGYSEADEVEITKDGVTEEFYVLKDNGSTLTLLAKYNLNYTANEQGHYMQYPNARNNEAWSWLYNGR